MQNTKSGFHTIDALRFFAFLKVFLFHIPIDAEFGLFGFLKKGGGIGVVFFFVLSGFLITYNLTKELSAQGSISIRRFYLKRVLRIWPLFYLFLLIMYLCPMHIKDSLGLMMGGYDPDWRFSFSFLENYRIIFFHSFPALATLTVTWSLCIEEHFYIVWGAMAVFTPARRIWMVLAGLILVSILARILCVIYIPAYHISTNEIITSLDYFAIGGLLGAGYALYPEKVDHFILSIPLALRWLYVAFTLAIVFAGTVIFQAIHLPVCLHPSILSAVFAGMIAIVLPRESPIRIGEGNVLSYLGRISYGLYLFHMVFILMFLHYCSVHHIRIDTVGTLCVGIVFTFAGTVLTSAFFYHFYERPFLSLRKYI